ncbi:hypothetical protein V8G54_012861 [Vigna mungo]|uniref:MULE transposase domain-containing protein n=1 Tax=Vigna mungo TaxID=3915 RepID=A0AAQ3NU07_VIGMU
MTAFIYACIYDNGNIVTDPESGVLFTSDTKIMIRIHRGFTLSRLIEILLQKSNKDPTHPPPKLHFRFPTQICGRHITFTTTQIQDDDDLEGAIDITEANPILTCIQLCSTYTTGIPSSIPIFVTQSTQDEPPSPTQPTHHSFDLNNTYLGEWQNDIQSYTELLTSPSTSQHLQYLSHQNTEPLSPHTLQENEILCLLSLLLDPFNEDEILSQHDHDEQQSLDIPSIQQQQQQPFTSIPYNPPQNFQSYEEFPSHLQQYPHAYDHHSVLHETFDHQPGTLTQGMRFQTKEQFIDALNTFHIQNHCTYKTTHSNTTRLRVQCVHQQCPWNCQAILRTRDQMVESDPSTPIATIIASIKTSMGYTTSYKKAWLAKQHAIEHVYGNWEELFNKLPCLLQAMQTFLPGFIRQNQQYFKRLFWTFKPCLDGFPYCKPLVQVDGTFLYGRYRGTLLVVVAQDGRNNILPIAFAIVEGETADAWLFFLKNLRRHVTPQQNLCLISDRQTSINAAFNRPTSGWTKGQCVHVYCIRHIAQNFTRRFRDTSLKKDLVNMAYAMTEPRCNYYYNIIRENNPQAAAWIDQIPRQQFTLAYDEGRKWGHLTTNLAEAINLVLKKTGNLPISFIVLATYTRCNSFFTEREKQITTMISAGHVYSENATKVLQDADSKSNTHRVVEFDRNITRFRVKEMENLLSDWMNDGVIVASFKRFIYHVHMSKQLANMLITTLTFTSNIGHHTKAQKFGLIQPQKGTQRVDQNHPESGLKWTSGNKHTHEIAHTVKPLATQEIIVLTILALEGPHPINFLSKNRWRRKVATVQNSSSLSPRYVSAAEGQTDVSIRLGSNGCQHPFRVKRMSTSVFP